MLSDKGVQFSKPLENWVFSKVHQMFQKLESVTSYYKFQPMPNI